MLVRSYGTEDRESRRLRAMNRELRDLEVRRQMAGRWFTMVTGLIQTAGPGVFWLVGGYLVLHHEVSVGTVVAMIVVLTPRLYGAVNNLGTLRVNIQGSLALFERLFAAIDHPPEVTEGPSALRLDRLSGSIGFEGVTFGYDRDKAPALRQVSFECRPGQLVAVVGPSGAGKTTLASILCRFYDPQEGRVLLDGRDVREISLESLARNIGIVLQDTFLFHATLRENIVYGRDDATEEEVQAAVRAAYLDEVVRALPDGLETVVGERGYSLSGGERQRVALARVILKNPAIVVLDEATSHLDALSEEHVQCALRSIFSDRTSIVIAHRLSTVLAADEILVLQDGSLVERGTHHELSAAGGLYWRLYERQLLHSS